MQPGQPFAGEDMALRHEIRRVVEIARHEMDIVRPARALEGERGAAARAEATPHAGRGFVVARRRPGERDILAAEAAGCGERSAARSPAGFAVTEHDEERLAERREAYSAAMA